MLGAGDRLPDATVWTAPRAPAKLAELALEGPFLLFFYIFDWTST